MDWMYKTVLNKQSPPPLQKNKKQNPKNNNPHTQKKKRKNNHIHKTTLPPPPHPTHTEGQTNKHPPTPVYSDTHMKFERLEF